jgi:ribosomal protein S6
MKKKYELILVFGSGSKEKDIKGVLADLKLVLEKEKLAVKKEESWGSADLEYSIGKEDKGNFWVLHLETEKSFKIGKIGTYLEREKKIIRHLLLKVKN